MRNDKPEDDILNAAAYFGCVIFCLIAAGLSVAVAIAVGIRLFVWIVHI